MTAVSGGFGYHEAMYTPAHATSHRASTGFLGTVVIVILLLISARGQKVTAGTPHLGYGANVADLDYPLLQGMGFNWVKLFSPPGSPQPANVLIRIEANATHMNDLNAFGNQVGAIAANHGAFVEAYEIGNEPNLDASYGWAAAPVAQQYAQLLCVAYDRIKAADPAAIVVSAGLAPTGRVQGNWNGHPGHNGLFQDERAFLREFLEAGGGGCLDAVGYHPYGFSANFDVTPDVSSNNPRQNCTNGFCFRGTEKIYEIMQQEGAGAKQVWATEFGWIVNPPSYCLSDPGWQGRAWQIVSEQEQADNLRGAFQYADANWPWMGAMVIFNLNFNTVPWYPECEQMRYYGVENRPAEDALRSMPKNPASVAPSLAIDAGSLSFLLTPADFPLDVDVPAQISNGGWLSTGYALTADSGGEVVPIITNGSGTIPGSESVHATITVASGSRPVGTYSGSVTLTADSGTLGVPQTLPVELIVVESLERFYLPLAFGP